MFKMITIEFDMFQIVYELFIFASVWLSEKYKLEMVSNYMST